MFLDADLWQSIRVGESRLQVWEDSRIRFGFTERGSSLEELYERRDLFPAPWHRLHQVHSSRINRVNSDLDILEGDGWITELRQQTVWIQTADCVPLFYWKRSDEPIGGILHVGWRGLHAGIIDQLDGILKDMTFHIETFNFFLGPAICSTCYLVKEDLHHQFSAKPWYADVFQAAEEKPGLYHFNLKAGISYSLNTLGVPGEQVSDIASCTHCYPDRFPSYRRDGKTGERVFSFLILK